MDLDTLPRGHVRNLMLREFPGNIGQHFQLHSVQTTTRHLDAQHVHALLALAVHALLQPYRSKAVGVDTARVEGGDRLLEAVDLFQVGQITCVHAHFDFLSIQNQSGTDNQQHRCQNRT
jgi:hypothetical protein